MKINEMFGLRSKKVLDVPSNVYMGIECEIENIAHHPDSPRDFSITNDNSLRNYGLEFISVPLSPTRLLQSFKMLHESLEYHDNGEDPFSPRTSTHIHLNCRHMHDHQVRQMFLLYALFEKYFFLMCDPSREDNIHCVPLSQTYLNQRYKQSLDQLVSNWHKYTAFNLLPLRTQGSVEFRHMHGTDDSELLTRWLSCIENLQALALMEPMDKATIVNRDIIVEWLHAIFVNSPNLLALDMDSLIADELLDIKLAFI
jgi:Putative amidoligase enzyme